MEILYTTLLSVPLVSVIIVWALKKWIEPKLKASIEHKYAAKLENLKAGHQSDLARLKKELDEGLNLKSMRYQFVFEKKLEAICTAFGKLANLEKELTRYVSLFGDLRSEERKENRESLHKQLGDFEDYFVPNRIFFDEELAEEITEIKNTIRNKAESFMVIVEAPHASDGDKVNPKRAEVWEETANYANKELPKIRRKIEAKYRDMLG